MRLHMQINTIFICIWHICWRDSYDIGIIETRDMKFGGHKLLFYSSISTSITSIIAQKKAFKKMWNSF